MRRVLVTGAADGIGRALALACRARGDAVVVLDRDLERLDRLAAEHGIEPLAGDLDRRDGHAALAAELRARGPYDVLVHNAGISCTGAFERSDLGRQHEVLTVNLEAPLVLTAALLREEAIRPGGTLVFLSSLSHQVGYPGAAVYAATKDALAAYGRSLSVALAPRRIHVTCVFPGPTRTAHAARYAPADADPSRRMPPERVARAVLRAVDRRRRTCVPGFGNRLLARLAPWFPRSFDRLMRKAILEPLERDARVP